MSIPLSASHLQSRGGYADYIKGIVKPLVAEKFTVSTKVELLSPHAGPLTAVEVDNIYNQFALIGGADGKVTLFDLRPAFKDFFRTQLTLKRTKISTGHKTSVTRVQWYPKDCGAFCTSSYDAFVRLWDTEKFTPTVHFMLSGIVSTCRMHYDGHLIGAAVGGGNVRLCDLRTGGSTHVLSAHRKTATDIDFCPVSSYIVATSSLDKAVKLWDLRKGSSKAVLMSLDWGQDHTSRAFRPQEESSSSFNMWDWNLDSAAVAHDGAAMAVRFLPCGRQLISTGSDSAIRCWDPATGQLLWSRYASVTSTNASYNIEIASSMPGYSNDDNILLVPGKRDGCINMFTFDRKDAASKGLSVDVMNSHQRMVSGLKYIQFRNKIISVASDGLILLWEPRRFQDIGRTMSFKGEDPEDTTCRKRKVHELDGRGRPVHTCLSGTHHQENPGLVVQPPRRDNVDAWSDLDETEEYRDVGEIASQYRVLGRPAAATSSTSIQTRDAEGTHRPFLPPIIQQILEDEDRIRNRTDAASSRQDWYKSQREVRR